MLENEKEIDLQDIDAKIVEKVCTALGISEDTLTDSAKAALDKVLVSFAKSAVLNSWFEEDPSRF